MIFQVLIHEPSDKELEGKVIRCLKIRFRESKLTTKCEHQMANILREAALNYHLNPLLATMCAHEVRYNRITIDNTHQNMLFYCECKLVKFAPDRSKPYADRKRTSLAPLRNVLRGNLTPEIET